MYFTLADCHALVQRELFHGVNILSGDGLLKYRGLSCSGWGICLRGLVLYREREHSTPRLMLQLRASLAHRGGHLIERGVFRAERHISPPNKKWMSCWEKSPTGSVLLLQRLRPGELAADPPRLAIKK